MYFDKQYITIVSTEDTEYFDWQKKILFKSWEDNKTIGDFINIESSRNLNAKESFKIIDGIKTFTCVSNPYYGGKNDWYPPYNKPIGIKAFLENIEPEPDRKILIIDPDCIFVNNINDLFMNQNLSGEYICYMDHNLWREVILNFLKKENLVKDDLEVSSLSPVGVPITIKEKYLRQIIDRWLLFALKLRSIPTSPLYLEWISEMWGLCVALAELKLKLEKTKTSFTPFKSLNTNIFFPPEKNLNGCKIFHYCLEVKENNIVIFDKRKWKKNAPDKIIYNKAMHATENVLFLEKFNSYLDKIK